MMMTMNNSFSQLLNPFQPRGKATPVAVARIPKPLRLAKALSVLMDSAIRIPFINKRIGLDGILGSFPIVGDILTFTVSLYGVGLGIYYRVPNPLVAQMVGNILVDLLIGAVPLMGDVFDIFFKANTRNYHLLMEHLEAEMPHILYPHLVAPPIVGQSTPHASSVVVDVTPTERTQREA